MSVDANTSTPGYMAPEQIRDARAVADKVDIYSLGAILFEILAGEPLHRRGEALATTLDRPVDSPAARRPERHIAPELDDASSRRSPRIRARARLRACSPSACSATSTAIATSSSGARSPPASSRSRRPHSMPAGGAKASS